MGIDLDELSTLAARMDNTGLTLLAPLVRDAVAEIRGLRAEIAGAMNLLEKSGIVPDCDDAEDCLLLRIAMICDQEAWARQERDESLARPAVPPWTREKPTEPGWYWQRHAGWTADHHRGIVRIWRTWDGDFSGPSRLHVHGNTDIPDGFEWSGPLPEPAGGWTGSRA